MTRINDRQSRLTPPQVTAEQRDGVIRGEARPGTTIEAINLSTAPTRRQSADETSVLDRVGPSGSFSGRLPDLEAGDIVRLRARDREGNVSRWVELQASGMGADTRNAQVALDRIGLTDLGLGVVELQNINPGRPLSEPGARLMLVNQRTGERAHLTLNQGGTIDAPAQLAGIAGDRFSVQTSDGRNNTDFSDKAGQLTVPGAAGGDGTGVDLDDPLPRHQDLGPGRRSRYARARFSGPLFVDGAAAGDVKQGQIANCYVPSAVAAIAHARPGLFEDLIHANDDGTFTVTFKEWDFERDIFLDRPVTVDGDLYVRSYGGPIYGTSAGPSGAKDMELWWPILEKAYASWKGGYDEIGGGGLAAEIFEDILGEPADNMAVRDNPAQVWDAIQRAVTDGHPISAGTYSARGPVRYTNSGLHGDHSYSILGAREQGGEHLVTLRNPWGQGEPRPGDGKDDGVFELELGEFMKYFANLSFIAG